MKLRLTIFISFLFLGWDLHSQDRTIDSLKLALKNAKHDTTRCNILSQLAETASDEEWPKFNEQLKNLAENKLKTIKPNLSEYSIYKKHFAASLNNIGFICQNKGDIPKALEYYGRSLKILEELGDKKGIATSLNNIGFIYQSQGDILKALEYFSKCLKIFEEMGDNSGIAYSLNNFGAIYNFQGDIPKALEYYSKCLKLLEKLGDKKGIATSLNNIGLIYNSQGDIPKALECYIKSLKLQEEIGDKDGIAESLNNIGNIYYSKGDPSITSSREDAIKAGIPKALEYYSKSLKIQEEIGDKKGIAYSLNNIGILYIKLASAEKASANKQKNYNKAIEYCRQSMKTSKELGFPENIRNAARNLSQIYKATGNHKNALENYELFILMRDSINNIATKKASIKSQFKIEYERKELEAKTEQEKKDLKNEEEKQKQTIIRNSFIVGFALVVILAVVIFRSFLQNKKKNKLIEDQKHLVEEKQKEIIDSIRYAQRIQRALLPNDKYFEKNLNKLSKKW